MSWQEKFLLDNLVEVKPAENGQNPIYEIKDPIPGHVGRQLLSILTVINQKEPPANYQPGSGGPQPGQAGPPLRPAKQDTGAAGPQPGRAGLQPGPTGPQPRFTGPQPRFTGPPPAKQ